MKPTLITLEAIAERKNLVGAFHKAAHGKRYRRDVQAFLRDFDVKIDIDGYFAAIDHGRLLQILLRRFKGAECAAQLRRILVSHEASPGRGLPIGSLTSQHFTNYYLDGLDRLLAALPEVRANIRYMDDAIWWCDTRQAAVDTLQTVRRWLQTERGLQVKPSIQLQPSRQGVTFCGFRILQGAVRLSRRRKRRYQQRRQYWEQLYRQGVIDANQLQLAAASVHAVTQGTDSLAWRQENLRRHPPIPL